MCEVNCPGVRDGLHSQQTGTRGIWESRTMMDVTTSVVQGKKTKTMCMCGGVCVCGDRGGESTETIKEMG